MSSTYNRELSWLAFNDRVLQEARDPNVPLLQRLRFLGIFSSNQDEFIKVRLAGLMRMTESAVKCSRRLSGGYLPGDLLPLISAQIENKQKVFVDIYHSLLKEMEAKDIRVVDETRLTDRQISFCRDYFASVVSQRLAPLIIHKTDPFPFLSDDMIYHGVKMTRGARVGYALIRLPVSRNCPRFVQLPSSAGGGHEIIFLDDIVRLCLDEIFFMFNYDHISAYTFKFMRDALLTLDDDVSASLMEKMEQGLENRMRGRPVRLVHDETMPEDLLKLLVRKLNIRREQLVSGGRYHMMRDLMKFPKIRPELDAAPYPPLLHPDITPSSSLLKVIKKKDVLLNYPYHTFKHFVDFLLEAAIDPHVSALYITLYRMAERSKVVNALINAANNGKNVVAVVELTARFDEERNMATVALLQRAGVKVLHGMPDLKVHGKLVLVERKERLAAGAGRRGRTRRRGYVYVGTGNLNEDTARLYSDFGFFTARPDFVSDVRGIFDFLISAHRRFEAKQLLAAPYFMRQGFEKLIEDEIAGAKRGEPAYIHAKCNTLTDQKMIELLYKAGRAGVEVRLIVRGACCLIPGHPELSPNIRAISIVDQFLEHARLFIFCGGGREKIFISSADWMTRNLDKRLEAAAPILSENIRKTLRDFFDVQWSDNVKARDLSELGANAYVSSPADRRVRAQTALYYAAHKAPDKPGGSTSSEDQ